MSVLVRATLAQQFVDLCCVGDLEDVRAAVQNGVDVNMKAEDGRTGLITALMYRQSEVASFLLGTEGVDVDVVPRGTALHEAARHEAKQEEATVRVQGSADADADSYNKDIRQGLYLRRWQ